MNYMLIGLGCFFLFFGRKLFWLFIGGMGFLFGYDLAITMFPSQATNTILIAALVCGAMGVFVAIMFKKFAIFMGGICAGALLAIKMRVMFFPSWPETTLLAAMALGGFIGGFIASKMFELFLILMSALLGSVLLVSSLPVTEWVAFASIVGLFFIGAAFQLTLFKDRSEKDKKED